MEKTVCCLTYLFSFCRAVLGEIPVIEWTTVSQQIPEARYGCQIAIYNNTLFIIGGSYTDTIYYIDLENLETTSDASYWSSSTWTDDVNYGSIVDMRDSVSFAQIDGYLYIAAPGFLTNYGKMYKFDLHSKQQVSSEFYNYTMPVAVSWPCMNLFLVFSIVFVFWSLYFWFVCYFFVVQGYTLYLFVCLSCLFVCCVMLCLFSFYCFYLLFLLFFIPQIHRSC